MKEITVKSYDLEVTIKSEAEIVSMEEIIDNFISPALLAIGFLPETVKEYIDTEG